MTKRRVKEMTRTVKSLGMLTDYIYTEKDDKFLVCLPLRIKKAERRQSTQYGPLLSEKNRREEE